MCRLLPHVVLDLIVYPVQVNSVNAELEKTRALLKDAAYGEQERIKIITSLEERNDAEAKQKAQFQKELADAQLNEARLYEELNRVQTTLIRTTAEARDLRQTNGFLAQIVANNNRIHELLQMQADHNARLTAHCNILSAQVNAHAANAMVSPRRVFASGIRC